MNTGNTTVTITRGATTVGTYTGFLGNRRIHDRPVIAPVVARAVAQWVFFFDSVDAPIEIGDIATFPDGTMTKLLDVRGYDIALQADLQRLPYTAYALWLPASVTSSVNSSSLNVTDVAYTQSGTVQAYLEPMPQAERPFTGIGSADLRGCYAYSITPIALRAVLTLNGELWLVERASEEWLVLGGYRAVARHQTSPIRGIS